MSKAPHTARPGERQHSYGAPAKTDYTFWRAALIKNHLTLGPLFVPFAVMWLHCSSNCKVGRKHHYEVTASTAWPGSQLLPNNTMNQDWASAEGAVRAQAPLHHCLQRWFLYIYCAADRSWTCPFVPRHNHACRKFIALVCQWGRRRLELLLHSWRAWFLAKSGDLYHVCMSVMTAPAPKHGLRTCKVKTQLVPLIGQQE